MPRPPSYFPNLRVTGGGGIFLVPTDLSGRRNFTAYTLYKTTRCQLSLSLKHSRQTPPPSVHPSQGLIERNYIFGTRPRVIISNHFRPSAHREAISSSCNGRYSFKCPDCSFCSFPDDVFKVFSSVVGLEQFIRCRSAKRGPVVPPFLPPEGRYTIGACQPG